MCPGDLDHTIVLSLNKSDLYCYLFPILIDFWGFPSPRATPTTLTHENMQEHVRLLFPFGDDNDNWTISPDT